MKTNEGGKAERGKSLPLLTELPSVPIRSNNSVTLALASAGLQAP